jgi:hypothetical protein
MGPHEFFLYVYVTHRYDRQSVEVAQCRELSPA